MNDKTLNEEKNNKKQKKSYENKPKNLDNNIATHSSQDSKNQIKQAHFYSMESNTENNESNMNISNNNGETEKDLIDRYYEEKFFKQAFSSDNKNFLSKSGCLNDGRDTSSNLDNFSPNDYIQHINLNYNNCEAGFGVLHKSPVLDLAADFENESRSMSVCTEMGSDVDLNDRIRCLSIDEFRQETNKPPVPPPTPFLSPSPSFRPPHTPNHLSRYFSNSNYSNPVISPRHPNSSISRFYPSSSPSNPIPHHLYYPSQNPISDTPSFNLQPSFQPQNNTKKHQSKRLKTKVNRFYQEDKNLNFNCSKMNNELCESMSERPIKKQMVLNKNFDKNKFDKSTTSSENDIVMKQKVISGLGAKEVYRDYKVSKDNVNNCNSKNEIRKQTKVFKSSIKNSSTNTSRSPLYQFESRPSKYMRKLSEKKKGDSFEVNDAQAGAHSPPINDANNSNKLFVNLSNPNNRDNYSSASDDSNKNFRNRRNNYGNSGSESSNEDQVLSLKDESTSMEEKLKIASAALLMGKYSKRTDFPPDDITYIQGSKRVLQHLHQLWLEQTTCDITIVCEGGNVLAHQFVMSAWSPTLASLFKQQCLHAEKSDQPVTINMTDYPRDVVADVINFMYTTDIRLELSSVGVVVAICREFDVSVLVNVCEDFLIKTANADAILLHYSVAANNNLKFAKTGLSKVIGSSIAEVAQNKYFCYLPYDRLYSLLSSSYTCGTEIDIFFVVVKWIDFNRKDRLKHSRDLLSLVRFQHITLEDLVNKVDQVSWVFVDKESKELLLQAFRFHALRMNGLNIPKEFPKDLKRCASFKKKKPLDTSLGEFYGDYQKKVDGNVVELNQKKSNSNWDRMEVMKKNPIINNGNNLVDELNSSEKVITQGWMASQTQPTMSKESSSRKLLESNLGCGQENRVLYREFPDNKKTLDRRFVNNYVEHNQTNNCGNYRSQVSQNIVCERPSTEDLQTRSTDRYECQNSRMSNAENWSESSCIKTHSSDLQKNLKSLQENFKSNSSR